MSEDQEAGFLDHILAHPEDDTPRLIYADWLDDHDQADRASFIRAGIERARLDEHDPRQDDLERRVESLLGQHPEWRDVVPEWAQQHVAFRRGFLERIWDVPFEPFLNDAAALFRAAPVRELSFDLSDASPPRFVAELPSMLTELNLTGPMPTGLLEGVLCCQHPTGLEELGLFSMPLPSDLLRRVVRAPLARNVRRLLFYTNELEDGGMPVLAQEPALCAWLETLCVGGNNVGPEAMRLMLRAQMPRLRHFTVGHNEPGVAGLCRLLDAPGYGALVDLELHAAHLDADGVRDLVARPGFAKLTRLSLDWSNLGDAGATALTKGKHLGPLRKLQFDSNDLTEAGIVAVARCKHLSELRVLNLGSNQMNRAAVTALVRSPHLRKVRCLELELNHLDEPALMALIEQWDLPAVTDLDLSFNNLTPAVVAALARAPWTANLVRLNLGNSSLGAEGAEALAASPYLRNLGELRLSTASIGDRGVVALAKSPILAGVWWLDLQQNGIGARGARALAESPTLRQPTTLMVGSNKGKRHWDAVRRRYGRFVSL